MAHLFHRRSPDEIADDYEVPLAQIYAALAYYYEHKGHINETVRTQIEVGRKLKEKRTGAQASLLS